MIDIQSDAFQIPAVLFLAVSGFYQFVRKSKIDNLEREVVKDEQRNKDRLSFNRIVRDRTHNIIDFHFLLYGILAPAIFTLFGFFHQYIGPWWIPTLTTLPPLASSLFLMSQIDVVESRTGLGPIIYPAATAASSELVYFASFIFTLFWPLPAIFLIAITNPVPDTASIAVLLGTPLLLFVISITDLSRVDRRPE